MCPTRNVRAAAEFTLPVADDGPVEFSAGRDVRPGHDVVRARPDAAHRAAPHNPPAHPFWLEMRSGAVDRRNILGPGNKASDPTDASNRAPGPLLLRHGCDVQELVGPPHHVCAFASKERQRDPEPLVGSAQQRLHPADAYPRHQRSKRFLVEVRFLRHATVAAAKPGSST